MKGGYIYGGNSREVTIVSCKFKACLGREENGKQIFKCLTWYPPENPTPAKARKAAQAAADIWERDIKANCEVEKENKETKRSTYIFKEFINDIWLPLCVNDGSHRHTTVMVFIFHPLL